MFTTASDLHDARFLCILAVLATVLTVFFTPTIARGVRALVFILVLSHLNYSPLPMSTTSLYQELRNLTHNNCSLALTQSQYHWPVYLNRMLFAVYADNKVSGSRGGI